MVKQPSRRRNRTQSRNTRRKAVRSMRRAGVPSSAARQLFSRRKIPRGMSVGRPRMVSYNKLVQPKVRTMLSYVDTKLVAPGSAVAVHQFRINSLFDPDYTGLGHQPAFRDQWNALYTKYRVIKTTWHVTFRPHRNAVIGTYVGVTDTYPYVDESHANQNQLPSILFTEVSEDTAHKFTEAGDLNFIRETGKQMRNVQFKTSGPSPTRQYTIRGGALMANVLDGPDQSDVATIMASNPAHPVYLTVGAMSNDGGTVCDWQFDIRLRMLVELSEPIDIDGS